MEPETDERDRTLWCGNLSDKVTEELLYELFLQAGPLENVKIPKDRSGKLLSYAFITFKHAVSVPYAIALMEGICLFKKPLRLQYRSGSNSGENPYTAALEKHRQTTRSCLERMPNPSTNPNFVQHQKSPVHVQERFYQNGISHNRSMGMSPPVEWEQYTNRYTNWSLKTVDRVNNGTTLGIWDAPPVANFQNNMHSYQSFAPPIQNYHMNGFSMQQTIPPWNVMH